MLFHQMDHLCKLKTRGPIQILVELKNLYSSTLKCDYLKQPFVYNFQDNFPAENVIYHQNHKRLIWTLSKAFEMSRNTPLASTAGLLSKPV